MRFYEAMKLLEEGKKVRKTNWEKDGYIYKNSDNLFADEMNDENPVFSIEGEWEEYIEPEQFREDTKMIKELIDWHLLIDGTSNEEKIQRLWDKLNEVVRIINKRVLDKED